MRESMVGHEGIRPWLNLRSSYFVLHPGFHKLVHFYFWLHHAFVCHLGHSVFVAQSATGTTLKSHCNQLWGLGSLSRIAMTPDGGSKRSAAAETDTRTAAKVVRTNRTKIGAQVIVTSTPPMIRKVPSNLSYPTHGSSIERTLSQASIFRLHDPKKIFGEFFFMPLGRLHARL